MIPKEAFEHEMKNDGLASVLKTTVTISVNLSLESYCEKGIIQMKRYNEDHIKNILYHKICELLSEKKYELMRECYKNPIHPTAIQEAFDEIIKEIEG